MVRSILGHGVLAAACLLLGRPRAAEALKIMTIGDSITEGWTVPCGYRAQLWDLLEQAGYQDLQFNGVLDTCGSQVTKCDDRCGQLQENNDFKHHNGFAGFKIHEVEESLDDILPWRTGAFPDIILVLLGTNDCLKAPANDVWTSQRRMKTLLSNIKGRRPGAKLIVGTIPPISRETQAEYGGLPWYARTLNNHIKGWVAPQVGVTVANTSTLIAEDMLLDGIHPSADGHRLIAEGFRDAIVSVLPPRRP